MIFLVVLNQPKFLCNSLIFNIRMLLVGFIIENNIYPIIYMLVEHNFTSDFPLSINC